LAGAGAAGAGIAASGAGAGASGAGAGASGAGAGIAASGAGAGAAASSFLPQAVMETASRAAKSTEYFIYLPFTIKFRNPSQKIGQGLDNPTDAADSNKSVKESQYLFNFSYMRALMLHNHNNPKTARSSRYYRGG
jgi:hypothetical protein